MRAYFMYIVFSLIVLNIMLVFADLGDPCATDANCGIFHFCDTTIGICVVCLTNGHCPGNLVCETSDKVCVDIQAECECCDTTSNLCDLCQSNDGCSGDLVCDTTANVCVGCVGCEGNYVCIGNQCICESPNVIVDGLCNLVTIYTVEKTCGSASSQNPPCGVGTLEEISSLAELQSYGLGCLTATATDPCNVWVGVEATHLGRSDREWVFTDGGVTISNTNPSDTRWHADKPDAANSDKCIFWNTQCDGSNCVTAVADGQSSTSVVIICRA